MRTIYWTYSTGEVSACKVLFSADDNLLVRSEYGTELLLRKDGEGEYWFTTRAEAEAAAEIIKNK